MAFPMKLAVLLLAASWGPLAVPTADLCASMTARARACVTPVVPFVGAALCPGRLRGGSDAEYSSGAEAQAEAGESPWDEHAQHNDPEEDEDLTLAMAGNFSAKLPERSRRLGPLQMSWGLSGTTVDADTEWRNDLRASIRGENAQPAYPAKACRARPCERRAHAQRDACSHRRRPRGVDRPARSRVGRGRRHQ
jgi:hypothetical protein